MKSTKRYILLFLIITIIQSMLMVFWGTRKENLYWDEFYTLERAHYFSSSNAVDHYIDEDPDFKVGEWTPISFVKDTLIVGEKETLFNEPVTDVLKKLTKSYNYSAYLNMAESVLSLGKFSIWPSIILNILFFVLNQLVLFALCRRLSDNPTFPVAVCSMYGFGSMCVSMAVFVRFYMFTTLLVSLFTFLHLLYFERDGEKISDHIKRFVSLILSFAILYKAHKNAQYTVVYGGVLVIAFAILLLVKKGTKRFLYYVVPMFCGGFFYLYTQTNYLNVLFNLNNGFSKPDGALGWTFDSITEFKLSYLPGRLMDMAQIFGRYIFGSFFVMLLFIGIVVAIFVLRKMGVLKVEQKDSFSPYIIVTSIAALVYIAIFTVFGLYEQVRYISFVFPELVIIALVIAYMAFDKSKYKHAFVIALIVIMAFFVNIKGKVDMLYPGDRDSIQRVRDFGTDSFVLNTGGHMTFMLYEMAVVAEDADEYYVYNDLKDGALDDLKDQLRDNMIVVNYRGVPADELHEMLKEKGYQIDWIADTYNYVFFTAVRN